MKKLVVRILLFIPFLFIFYSLLLIIWGSFAPPRIKTNLKYPIAGYAHMFSRISEVRQVKDIDILFLGASFTYRGFDPRIFKEHGYTTFNLGSAAQTPLQTKSLLNRYLNALNPKLIIYEVSPRTFEFDGVEASLDVLANDKIDLNSLEMALTLNNIKTYNTLLYAYYRQLFNKNKNIHEDPIKDNDLYIPGGYVEKLFYNQHRPNKYERKRWTPLKYQINSFESNLKKIRKKGIKVILVQAPITSFEYDKYKEDSGRIDAYFFEKTPHYYDFNNFLKMNDSLHFFDEVHLNQLGVQIFNEELIKKVILNVQPEFDTKRR